MSYNYGITEKNSFIEDISRGKVGDFSFVNIAGFNDDLDSAVEEDLWTEGGTLTYLAGNELVNIVSTDAADTGPLAVLIGGVTAEGESVQDIVVLNGVTPVASTQVFYRINFMFLTGTGSTNVGAITATAAVSGTVQCHIFPGRGISQHGFLTIPAGQAAIIKQVEINAAKLSGGGTPLIEFKIYARFTPANPWIVILDRRLDTSVQDSLIIPFPLSGIISPMADIRFAAQSDTNNTEALCRMTGIQYEL
jgi:hypothetical protein